MVVTRYVNGVQIKEEDLEKIVIKNPIVVEIIERVRQRVKKGQENFDKQVS